MSEKGKEYKILALTVNGKNNIIHRSGDIVLGGALNNINALIDGESIEEVTKDKEVKITESKKAKK